MTPDHHSTQPIAPCSSAERHKVAMMRADYADRSAASYALTDFLAGLFSGRDTCFCTITAKAGIGSSGCRQWFTREVAEQEVYKLENRFQRKVLGQKYLRQQERLAWLSAIEGDGQSKLRHAHVLCERPAGWSFENFKAEFSKQWRRSEWALPIFDVRDAGDITMRIKYMTKEGPDSLILPHRRVS